MAEIRLSKLTKEFNIGLQTLVDFLNEKGAGVDMNPNAKISDSYLPAIEAKFGDEQKLKQDSEKVAIKLKEIIEMGPLTGTGKPEALKWELEGLYSRRITKKDRLLYRILNDELQIVACRNHYDDH